MRLRARGLVFLLGMTLCVTIAVAEQQEEPIVIHRYRQIRNPQSLDLQRYERIEFPLRLDELAAEIKLAQATRASLRRQIAEYERFKTNAFFLTLERLHLELLATDLRLQRLKRERLLLQYYGSEEIRVRKRQMYGATSADLIY